MVVVWTACPPLATCHREAACLASGMEWSNELAFSPTEGPTISPVRGL